MTTIVNDFTSAAISDRGLSESRPQNEDSFIELPDNGLFVVADGVGGAQAGEVASQMAVEIVAEAFVNMGPNADPEETMRVALDRANEAIFQMSRDLAQLSSMATTVVALHISGDMATIAHVGDSRIYRLDQKGQLIRETDDHSLVEEEVRAGRMTAQQALNHPSRNVISRALGAESTVQPDVKCVLVHPGTTFLLCSDGITRHIDDPELREILLSDFGPDDICARLKEICFSRGAEDNLTAVVVSFPGDRQVESSFMLDDADIEETTIAGIREPVHLAEDDDDIEIVSEAGSGSVYDTLEPETGDFPAAASLSDDEPYLISAAEETGPSTLDVQPAMQARPMTVTYADAEPEGRSGAGAILPILGALLIGAVLGGIGGYYFATANQPVAVAPVISEQKSNNVPLTSFEETRRLVDADPVRYLNANAASPQEADDYFWLGRALLLTGKPIEAKRAFEEARRLLPSVQEPSNVKTMSHEIAMALTIVNDPRSAEAFARESAVQGPNGANTNAVPGNASPAVR